MQTQKFQPQRRDVYQDITNHIINALDKGEVIWKKPWNTYGMPKNIRSNTFYRGFNIFFLNYVTMVRRYKAPYFLTFLQTQELGGRVKKGERGTDVIYWATVEDKYKTVVRIDETTGAETNAHPHKRVPKIYTVFNIEQTEGIAFPSVEIVERTHVEKLEACEKVIEEMPNRPLIEHFGDEAFYLPSRDLIRLPLQSQFQTDEKYYCTTFHELAHSTGHKSRLNRDDLRDIRTMGDGSYSKEELTAELTASFLCGITGIEQTLVENSVAYIQHWLNVLKDDKYFFVRAAAQAQRAADYILGYVHETTQAHTEEETAAC